MNLRSENTNHALDSEGKYNGNKTYYWAFHEHLMHKLNENKVAIVFSEIFEPIPPTNALNKVVTNQPLSAEEEKTLSRFRAEKLDAESKAGHALTLIIGSLNSNIRSQILHITRNNTISTRQKCLLIMNYLQTNEGAECENSKNELMVKIFLRQVLQQ
jgi:hypothetical protein